MFGSESSSSTSMTFLGFRVAVGGRGGIWSEASSGSWPGICAAGPVGGTFKGGQRRGGLLTLFCGLEQTEDAGAARATGIGCGFGFPTACGYWAGRDGFLGLIPKKSASGETVSETFDVKLFPLALAETIGFASIPCCCGIGGVTVSGCPAFAPLCDGEELPEKNPAAEAKGLLAVPSPLGGTLPSC